MDKDIMSLLINIDKHRRQTFGKKKKMNIGRMNKGRSRTRMDIRRMNKGRTRTMTWSKDKDKDENKLCE